jgi:serine/threonine-protein kinase HipA
LLSHRQCRYALEEFCFIENAFGEFELSPAYDLVSTALVIADDQEETALTINGKKSRLKKKDFDALASNLEINTKVLNSIYAKFEKHYQLD